MSVYGSGHVLEHIEGEIIEGYEIHNGVTMSHDENPFSINVDNRYPDGAVNEKGNVIGTYLHGVFDNDVFRKKMLDHILSTKRPDDHRATSTTSNAMIKDAEYERLASIVSERVDIKAIYDLLQIDKAKV